MSSVKLKAINRNLTVLSRVVIDPRYRGAGITAKFIKKSCTMSGKKWVETLTEMGHINGFFEKAGFRKLGPSCSGLKKGSITAHSKLYKKPGKEKVTVSAETYRKSLFSDPIYYIFDNRENIKKEE